MSITKKLQIIRKIKNKSKIKRKWKKNSKKIKKYDIYKTHKTHIQILKGGSLQKLNSKSNRIKNTLTFFEPQLNTINNENTIRDKQFFDFIKSVIEFKSNFNKEEEYNKHAIQLCLSLENYYSLLKYNYKKGILGYEKISNPEYLTNPDTNILVLSLHGQIETKIFKLPSNINLVFLSPVKYSTCLLYRKLIKELEKPEIVKKYLKNPSCYNKSKFNNYFKESIIYYGGQYCIDLNLSRKTSTDGEHVSGLHILDSNINNITPFKIEDNDSLPSLPDLSKDSYDSSLSELLKYLQTSKYEGKQFTIFLTPCREFIRDDYKKNYHNVFSFYENSIKATNFKAQHKDDILDIEQYKLLYTTCKTPSTDFFPALYKIQHIQHKKYNNNINKNTIKSSSKLNITDESKIYNYPEIFQKKLETYNDANYPEYKYITLGKFKQFIKTYDIKHIKFENIYNSLINIYDQCDVYDYYNKCFTIYNNLVIFILDNNIQLAFECIFYILINLYINKTKEESYINAFIKTNKNILTGDIVLDNLHLKNLEFFNITIDKKLGYNITSLSLKNNFLDKIDNESINLISELKKLYLNNNNITIFPTFILKLKKLQILDLTDNPINDNIKLFPLEFTNLFKLNNTTWNKIPRKLPNLPTQTTNQLLIQTTNQLLNTSPELLYNLPNTLPPLSTQKPNLPLRRRLPSIPLIPLKPIQLYT